MEAKELREVFYQEWSPLMADAAWQDEEDADELAATGQVLVTAYLTEAAPPVQPRAIEQTVQGEIAGVRVRRIVDLLDTDGSRARLQDDLQATEWSLGRTQSATDNLRDDHIRGRRPVSAGHGHENQDGTGSAVELSGWRRKPALR
jgi:hypothetical protein